jgi:glutamate synthase domain-containing protein 1
MCGIAGLFSKTTDAEAALGRRLSGMLAQLSERGPDSAGIAVYRDGAAAGAFKATLHHPDEGFDWAQLHAALARDFGDVSEPVRRGTHAVVTLRASFEALVKVLDAEFPSVRLMGFGERIEIYKERGLPQDVIRSFDIEAMSGSHALGHTRMATESAVTTEHSHPFSTGVDLCLVHNGSLSNHNRLRTWLARRGIRFSSDNDTEVAAGYLTWCVREGASLKEALEAALTALDGFYTFAVGTRDGFAILRDPIACKPAVIAETDEWVAMATEYRAIATLPGAEQATIWEPRPGTVYAWQRQ